MPSTYTSSDPSNSQEVAQQETEIREVTTATVGPPGSLTKPTQNQDGSKAIVTHLWYDTD